MRAQRERVIQHLSTTQKNFLYFLQRPDNKIVKLQDFVQSFNDFSDEYPDLREDEQGLLYKENYGMASARAVGERSGHLDPFERAKRAFFREGISSSRIYLREGHESVGSILVDIITGVQSAFTYVGASSLEEFYDEVCVGVQSSGGFHEGTPHGKVRR